MKTILCLLLIASLGVSAILIVTDHVPVIVRDLVLEREVRELEAQLRDQRAWSKACRNVIREYSSQLRECRRQCFFEELGS